MERLAYSLGLVGVLSLSSAMAADLGVRPAPAPIVAAPAFVPAYTWTGLYVGGEFGGGWGHSQTTFDSGNRVFPSGTSLAPLNTSGVLGGVALGYNYQIYGPLVLGVEGNFDWGNLQGSATSQSPTVPFSRTVDFTGNNLLANVSGRLGYAWNNVLLYGKGGAGWGKSPRTVTTINAAGLVQSTSIGEEWGVARPLVGGGVEWAFAPNWSLKAEYDYLFANQTNSSENANGLVVTTSGTSHLQIAKVGVNYLFNWPILPAAFH
jgi:outer membrane immunogenic protein